MKGNVSYFTKKSADIILQFIGFILGFVRPPQGPTEKKLGANIDGSPL